MYVMSSELYGAASLSQRGPTLSVPVALLVCMAESSYKNPSFCIGLILSVAFSDSLD